MKKYFPVMVLLLAVLLFSNHSSMAAASEGVWELTWNKDGSINETVSISKAPVITYASDWQCSSSTGKWVLKRHVSDWQAYSALSDRLPLRMSGKDYWLWQTNTLAIQKPQASNSLYAQLSTMDNARLSIQVPGIIRQSSAIDRSEDTATWNLSDIDSKAPLMQTVDFDGLVLGTILFGLGAIVIMIIYLKHIRRVNRLIDEEYSLQRAAEEFARGGEEDKEAE